MTLTILRRIAALVILLASLSSARDAWVVRPDGTGPVKIGMTLPELSSLLHQRFSMPPDKDDQGCFYVSPRKHPRISFMIEDGHLVRVDVTGAGVFTAKETQVGDSEKQALKAYGAKMKVEPSAYSGERGGHYLTVRSPDGRYGIRFETENGKVTTFYAGQFEAIQYVEGCE